MISRILLSDKIDSEIQILFERLASEYQKNNIPLLLRASDGISRIVIRQLRSAIAQCAPQIFSGAIAAEDGFQVKGRAYRVWVKPSDAMSTDLVILIAEATPARPGSSNPTWLDLNGLGELRRVSFDLPARLSHGLKGLSDLVAALVRTGDAWLEGEILALLEVRGRDISNELYRYLKSILPASELIEHVWFGCGCTGHGIYLPNADAARRAIRDAGRHELSEGHGGLQLVTEFIGADVPYNVMSAFEAANRKRSLTISLKATRYSRGWPRLVTSEQVVLNSHGHTIFPVFSDSSGFLVATFPADPPGVHDPIEKAVKSHAAELARRFKNVRHEIESFVRCYKAPLEEKWPRAAVHPPVAAGRIMAAPRLIFVSYNRADKEEVNEFCRQIEAASIPLWIDQDAIEAGNPFQQDIEDGIRNSRAALVFMGPSGPGSYQRLETRALVNESTRRLGFRVIPILLRGVTDFPDDALLLRTFAALSVEQDGHDRALQKVISVIRTILSDEGRVPHR